MYLRIPRPTENQGLFLFTCPRGIYRRFCHELPGFLCCALDLPVVTQGTYKGGHK